MPWAAKTFSASFSFGQKRIVARLDASPTYGTAAERHVGNAYLFRQSSDCLHVKHLVLQRVWVDKIGATQTLIMPAP